MIMIKETRETEQDWLFNFMHVNYVYEHASVTPEW